MDDLKSPEALEEMLKKHEAEAINKILDYWKGEQEELRNSAALSEQVRTLKLAILRESEEYPEYRYRYKILEVCRALHMLLTGSMDGVSQEDCNRMVEWLDVRLHTWVPSTAQYEGYDNCVYNLAKVTLADWRKAH